MDVRVGLWRRLSTEELMLLNCGVGEDSWESLGLQGDPTSAFWRRSALGFLWREWCWSWNSSTLATSCEELTHCKRLWCWEGLGAEGEGDNRGWDGWMASLTRWTWVWVNSGSWWWTGRPGVLRFMGSQRLGHDWATELNWTSALKWEGRWGWWMPCGYQVTSISLPVRLPDQHSFYLLWEHSSRQGQSLAPEREDTTRSKTHVVCSASVSEKRNQVAGCSQI